jgi:hypothetical protein
MGGASLTGGSGGNSPNDPDGNGKSIELSEGSSFGESQGGLSCDRPGEFLESGVIVSELNS